MKYFTYIFRNARRNPIRTLLTIASTSICLFLMMILLAFFAMRDHAGKEKRRLQPHHLHERQRLCRHDADRPGSRDRPDGRGDRDLAVLLVSAASTTTRATPFAQFAVDPDTVFTVLNEFHVPDAQLADFKASKDGAAIGRRLASDWDLKLGDPLPLKGDVYPVDMDLTVRAIYDGPSNRNLRICFFHYDYFDEALKKVTMSSTSGGSLATDASRSRATPP